MKAAFISTVLNEGQNIVPFLRSILAQTKLPYEVIIVDGGSSDNTLSELKKFEKQFLKKGIEFRVLQKVGNRSVGRNWAIKNSKSSIIACSDAGCVLDKDWFLNITKPFSDKSIDVVAGYYKPVTQNIFQQCLATYTCVMPDRIDEENFLPSSRSVAFRKRAWQEIRGYPQDLDTCEDLVFAKRLKSKGFRFAFARNAIVFWPQRKNLLEAFIQFFKYARGDGQALYFRPQTPFLFMRYALGLFLLMFILKTKNIFIFYLLILSVVFYILWSISKNYKYVRDARAIFWLPILQFTADIAVILGMTLGVIQKVFGKIIFSGL
jgi:glycosyltransferase involved in cell wall biosynthesis